MGGKSKSQGRQAFEHFIHSKMAMTGLVVFVLVIGFCYIYPNFYKFKFDDPTGDKSVSPGTDGHVLGTDETGYDLLARMMRGTQRDFEIIIVSTVIALTLGILIGALAGYFGKFVDNLMMRFVDIMLTVPYLVILILVCAKLPRHGRHGDGHRGAVRTVRLDGPQPAGAGAVPEPEGARVHRGGPRRWARATRGSSSGT